MSFSAALVLLGIFAPAEQPGVETRLPSEPVEATGAGTRIVQPVLEFPEEGLDDPAAFEGYRTRFFRDARGNAFQVYLNQRRGRVVGLWANAANESAGFTVRDGAGQPARLEWGSREAVLDEAGGSHSIRYSLRAEPVPLEIGRFLVGTMRIERDFQHHEHDLAPFGDPSFPRPELDRLIGHLERLDPAERERHLALLSAPNTERLRERMHPAVRLVRDDSSWTVTVSQSSFDGRNRLRLDLSVSRADADVGLRGGVVSLRPRSGRPLLITVRGTTDAAALTPLERAQIFTDEFLAFLAEGRAEHDRIMASAPESRSPRERDRLLELRRLERQVRGLELLSYREKLMAGLPNFATYFGRDMLMTALMMQPIWRGAMSEHVVGSVLRKLAPSGEVSHEEALGGQAIRENTAVYDEVMDGYFELAAEGDARADSVLSRARDVLADLQRVRENYGNMMDDDFQFPVLVARYLADDRISDDRKRAFLLEPAGGGEPGSRLALLLSNLDYVARMAEPYARDPVPTNLVGFRRRAEGAWFPGSWRDSNAGYANGRFAMDINTIWVPEAIEALGRILAELGDLGFGAEAVERLAPAGTPLGRYVRDRPAVRAAARVWRGTAPHFRVRLGADEVRDRVTARLAALPDSEREYWAGIFEASAPTAVEFLALSLDHEGRPIPVVSTDPATRLFLDRSGESPDAVLRDVRAIVSQYPVGLFVAGLGTLVANDAYALPEVWEAFRRDPYHSPRVVWGREVNLVILGLVNQIRAGISADADIGVLGSPASPHLRELRSALRKVVEASEASGLKSSELWSYRIENGRLMPIRYGSSSDVQLWNLTDLVVQYELARLQPAGVGAARQPSPRISTPARRSPVTVH
jgi:hypothetical protein